MIRTVRYLLVLSFVTAVGCSADHLVNDRAYREITEKTFTEREDLAANRKDQLFRIFETDLTLKQAEALKFLFAYMPLCDLADYSGEFFLANVNASLRTIEDTPWAKSIPEDVFLHYVLPPRINNENLDSFRIVFYNEIIERVKGKNIADAALEINHWCHEKVSYQPADSRTSAPMSTILSARGRCGEESTFTVAALRTAGIPARQVYTPRWAHSDDNHAWVEIWDNGKWYYMGACEPEPVLDRGWFTEPARRAMLVHTKSFGAPYGNENSINKHRNFTEVNNLAKYAVTKKISVKVVDNAGKPVKGAIVEFQLYNYAEFYPLATIPSDDNGISQFETGLGDLMIWGRKDGIFGYRKITVNETDTLLLTLSADKPEPGTINLDLGVPVMRSPLPGPSPELIELNTERVNEENLIRQKYIDSWMQPAEAVVLAAKLGTDTARFRKAIVRSMGNYAQISSFISLTPDSLRQLALSLLEILPDKDLRDTKATILTGHLRNSHIVIGEKSAESEDLFLDYVLNPRIANEILVDWRSFLSINLPVQLKENAVSDPSFIIKYLDENLKIAEDENYSRTPITPRGVIELKVTDRTSRAICFVAICRTLGIPSRLEPGSRTPQYFFNDLWTDAWFIDQHKPSGEKGFIRFISTDAKPVPEYNTHFTIAKLDEGRFNTLEYDDNIKAGQQKEDIPLSPGFYMLVTGNRISDSRILSQISFFELSEGEHKAIQISLRQEETDRKPIGRIDVKDITGQFGNSGISAEVLAGKGFVVIWTEPEKEPTKHVFNDLPLLKKELDSWGGYMLFLSGQSSKKDGFNPASLKGLPEKSLFSTDPGFSILKRNAGIDSLGNRSLPFIAVSDKNGNVIFTSAGYRIGIGEQILKYLK
jgi:transglutaminase-like putative cysteine protease